jgi:type VI secretion system protein ImpI
VQGTNKNPLKFAVDAERSAGDSVAAASRGTCRPSRRFPARSAICRRIRWPCSPPAAPPYAAPSSTSRQQLTLRFERDNKPLLATSGRRWRAFGRYHQALRQDDDWSERLLARDFAQAYEEQIRLISTLTPTTKDDAHVSPLDRFFKTLTALTVLVLLAGCSSLSPYSKVTKST